MMRAEVLNLDGTTKATIEMPAVFNNAVRVDLIRRAVTAESSQRLQPQGHYVLAGMQTTATYYGAMNSYRTGRHMGRAIRPREKLGGGIQGKVRRVPSAVTGKRAHPHVIEKIINERLNKREYQRALESAVAATHSKVVDDRVENINKTKEITKVFNNLKLALDKKKRLRSGLRRSSRIRHYKKTVLLVVANEGAVLKAARNIAGVDVCSVKSITAELLAPGGNPGRMTLWSESAINALESAIKSRGAIR